MIEGPECEYQQKIENEIYQLLQKLYSKNTRTEAWFSTWVGKQISQEQAAWLERQFAKGEIKMAVFSLQQTNHRDRMVLQWHFSKKIGIL